MVQISTNKYTNEFLNYIIIKSKGGPELTSENYKKEIMDKISEYCNTFLILLNRNDFTDKQIIFLEKNHVSIRDIIREYGIEIHSKDLENNSQNCELSVNIFLYKMDNVDDLFGLESKLVSMNLEYEIYTKLNITQDKQIIIENSFNNNKNSFNNND